MDRAYVEGVQRRVLVQIDDKMTDFWKFIKCDKILVNIRSHVQAVSPKATLGHVTDRFADEIEHILKVCNVVLWFELMENCKKITAFYMLIKFL